MNNKFGRDDRYRNERHDERQHDEPYREDRFGDDRWLRSPERDFETSGPYRQPYDESWRREPEGWGSSVGYRGTGYRYESSYARSPHVPAATAEGRGGYAGRGPKGYTRTDERIREDVCDRLSWNDEVDATDITVRVEAGEVTLEGSVETRHMKRLAEDVAEQVPGVQDVHNRVRVTKPMLTELKEKLTGAGRTEHFANTGTKTTGAHGSYGRNGIT